MQIINSKLLTELLVYSCDYLMHNFDLNKQSLTVMKHVRSIDEFIIMIVIRWWASTWAMEAP